MEAKIETTKRRGNKTKTLDKATLNQMRRSKKENETKYIVKKRGENEQKTEESQKRKKWTEAKIQKEE